MTTDIQFQHLGELNMFELLRHLVKSFLLLAKLVRLLPHNVVEFINALVKLCFNWFFVLYISLKGKPRWKEK